MKSIAVNIDVADDARKILASRVRLKFTEKRRWFGLLGPVFLVTGPAEVIDSAEAEIRLREVELWRLAQW